MQTKTNIFIQVYITRPLNVMIENLAKPSRLLWNTIMSPVNNEFERQAAIANKLAADASFELRTQSGFHDFIERSKQSSTYYNIDDLRSITSKENGKKGGRPVKNK